MPQRPILDPKAALVTQEHHAVAGSKLARTALDAHCDILTEIASSAQPLARGLVERLHLVVGMGEDDPACGGCGLPVAIPRIDQLAPRLLARRSGVDMALLVVGADRLARPSGR